jgi:hypothetical protein
LLASYFYLQKKLSPIGFWSAPSPRQAGEKNMHREKLFSRRAKFSLRACRAEGADQKPIKKTVLNRDGSYFCSRSFLSLRARNSQLSTHICAKQSAQNILSACCLARAPATHNFMLSSLSLSLFLEHFTLNALTACLFLCSPLARSFACLISRAKSTPVGFWSPSSTRQAGEKKVRRENNFFTARKIFSPAGRTEGADQKPIKN